MQVASPPVSSETFLRAELERAPAAAVVELFIPGVSARSAWEIFADTDLLNRAIGSPEVTVCFIPIKRGVARREFTTALAVPGPYEEEHYQWEEGRWVGGRRFFLQPPLERFLFLFEQREAPGGAVSRMRVGFWGRDDDDGRAAAQAAASGLADGFRALQPQLQTVHQMRRPRLVIPSTHEPRLNRAELRAQQAALLDSGEDARAVEHLVKLIEEEDDHHVVHMAPLALAAEWEVSADAVIDTFLRAARLGMLEAKWSVACPGCRGLKQPTGDVAELGAGAVHCEDCNISFDADPNTNVALTFAPTEAVRRVEETFACVGAPTRTPHVKVQVYLPPHAAVELARASPGLEELWISCPELGEQLRWERAGTFELNDERIAREPPTAAGAILANRTSGRIRVRVEDRSIPDTFLRASMVLERPRFRDLFGADQWEFLSAMQRAWRGGFGLRAAAQSDHDEEQNFDLVVVGAGPGGEAAALRAAQLGQRVALVEASSTFGGPSGMASKAMREAVHQIVVWAHAAQKERSWVNAGRRDALLRSLFERRFALLRRYVASLEMQDVLQRLTRVGVSLHHGCAAFGDGGRVVVTSPGDGAGRTLFGRFVVLATGSRPARPAWVPFDEQRVLDATAFGRLEHLPRTLCVVGAGVIGCEFATILAALGVKVTVVGGGRAPLPFLDGELARAGLEQMAAAGIRILPEARVAHIRLEHDQVLAAIEGGEVLASDALLYAEGREANSDGLRCARAGIDVGRYGRLVVDDQYRTSNPSIFAVGDLIGPPGLASTAAEQGKFVAEHLFGERGDRRAPLYPTTLWTFPELAGVGMTEEQAQRSGIDYVVGRAWFRDLPRGILSGDLQGWLKLIARHDDGVLLGVHIVGEQACELIHYGRALVEGQVTAADVARAGFSAVTFHGLYQAAAEDLVYGSGRRPARAPLEEAHAPH